MRSITIRRPEGVVAGAALPVAGACAALAFLGAMAPVLLFAGAHLLVPASPLFVFVLKWVGCLLIRTGLRDARQVRLRPCLAACYFVLPTCCQRAVCCLLPATCYLLLLAATCYCCLLLLLAAL